MFAKYSVALLISGFLFFTGCGKFNPTDDQVNSTSDGSYVVETPLSDRELLDYGMAVVYRFQSAPNVVAVRRNESSSIHNSELFSAPKLASLIEKNSRNHPKMQTSNSRLLSNNVSSSTCFSAYCEAGFNSALNLIQQKSVTLNPIQISVIDSGVLAATPTIKNALFSSSNISGDTNTNNWLPHATMISSLFAGVVAKNKQEVTNIYAPNSKINSIKITFAGDPDTSAQTQYGSMQLAVAMDQAVASGSKIVNLSLTYAQKPDDNVIFAEQAIMSAAAQNGVIFVAAAGNDNANIDATPVYPASYNVNNLIVAGSHTSSLQKATSSNFGATVDLSAQGASVTVNDKSGGVNVAGGTSFAAPLIVSALSLYLGINSNDKLDTNQILTDLFSSADPYYSSNSSTVSQYGRLNAQGFIASRFEHLK